METPKISLTAQEELLFRTLLACVAWKGRSSVLRVAGGWVRDKLLGKSSHDIDIAIDDQTGVEFATTVNEYMESINEETHHLAVIQANPEKSKHMETATLKVFGLPIDFVNLRCEEYTNDSRFPGVRFGSPAEDASRRDFTINTLFYNINTREIEDFTKKGISDLDSGVIRTPLDPVVTFCDDPLRILRAVRFSNRFGFRLDTAILHAAHTREVQVAFQHKLSKERIMKEIEGMFLHENMRPALALKTIHNMGIYEFVFQMPIPMSAPTETETTTSCSPAEGPEEGLDAGVDSDVSANAATIAVIDATSTSTSTSTTTNTVWARGTKLGVGSKKRGGGSDFKTEKKQQLSDPTGWHGGLAGLYGLDCTKLQEESISWKNIARNESTASATAAGGGGFEEEGARARAGTSSDDFHARKCMMFNTWVSKSICIAEWLNVLRIIRYRIQDQVFSNESYSLSDFVHLWNSTSISSSSIKGSSTDPTLVSVAEQCSIIRSHALNSELSNLNSSPNLQTAAKVSENEEQEQEQEQKQKHEQEELRFMQTIRVEYICAAVGGLRGLLTLDTKQKEVSLPLLLLRDSLKLDVDTSRYVSLIYDSVDEFQRFARTFHYDGTGAGTGTGTGTGTGAGTGTDVHLTREQGGLLLRSVQEYWRQALWFACADEIASSNSRCSGDGSGSTSGALTGTGTSTSSTFATTPNTTANADFGAGLNDIFISTPSTLSKQADSEAESDIILRYFLLEKKLTQYGLDGVWDLKPLFNGKSIMKTLHVKPGPKMSKIMSMQLSWQLSNPRPVPQESQEAYMDRCIEYLISAMP